MKKLLFITLFICTNVISNAQNDKKLVKETLLNYIEGTSKGQPDRIRKAFHKDLNLYPVSNGNLKITNGQRYISYFKEGQKNDRIGKIISIEIVNDAATAKVEIFSPSRKRLYTDFMMLLKVENNWKIIHKSYTSVTTEMKISDFIKQN